MIYLGPFIVVTTPVVDGSFLDVFTLVDHNNLHAVTKYAHTGIEHAPYSFALAPNRSKPPHGRYLEPEDLRSYLFVMFGFAPEVRLPLRPTFGSVGMARTEMEWLERWAADEIAILKKHYPSVEIRWGLACTDDV